MQPISFISALYDGLGTHPGVLHVGHRLLCRAFGPIQAKAEARLNHLALFDNSFQRIVKEILIILQQLILQGQVHPF